MRPTEGERLLVPAAVPAWQPWWWAPPGERGVPLALNLILATTHEAVIAVPSLIVYSCGFELRVLARRPFPDGNEEHADPTWLRGGDDEVRPEYLRLGIAYADG